MNFETNISSFWGEINRNDMTFLDASILIPHGLYFAMNNFRINNLDINNISHFLFDSLEAKIEYNNFLLSSSDKIYTTPFVNKKYSHFISLVDNTIKSELHFKLKNKLIKNRHKINKIYLNLISREIDLEGEKIYNKFFDFVCDNTDYFNIKKRRKNGLRMDEQIISTALYQSLEKDMKTLILTRSGSTQKILKCLFIYIRNENLLKKASEKLKDFPITMGWMPEEQIISNDTQIETITSNYKKNIKFSSRYQSLLSNQVR